MTEDYDAGYNDGYEASADALEAKDEMIADLRVAAAHYMEVSNSLVLAVNEKDARIAALEAALKEVHRRTGLLMTQNQGRWNMSLEHDRRTADVLSVNQDITSAALGENK